MAKQLMTVQDLIDLLTAYPNKEEEIVAINPGGAVLYPEKVVFNPIVGACSIRLKRSH